MDWSPPARTRLLVALVATLLVALVATLLVGATPAVAAEPGDAPDPLTEGGRVEVESAGYALTIPDDWTALVTTEDENDLLLEGVEAAAPDLAPFVEAFLASGAQNILIAMAPPTDTHFLANCNVILQPSAGLTPERAAATTADALGDVAAIVSSPTIAEETLPAGETAVIDLSQRIQTPDGAELVIAQRIYILVGGLTMYVLSCSDLALNDEVWASMARSFDTFSPGE